MIVFSNFRVFPSAFLLLLTNCTIAENQEEFVAQAICGSEGFEVTVTSSGENLEAVRIARGHTVYVTETIVSREGEIFNLIHTENYFDGDEFKITLHLGSGDVEREISDRMANAQERLSGHEPRLIKEAVNLYKKIAQQWPINENKLLAMGSDCNSGIWAYEDS